MNGSTLDVAGELASEKGSIRRWAQRQEEEDEE
jgi:hypothetical protein